MDIGELAIALVYVALAIASVFLFRRAPDSPQRIAMLVLVFGFAAQAVTLLAASFNGYDEEFRVVLWFMRRTGHELIQTGVIIIVMRLLWKEWVRGALRHS